VIIPRTKNPAPRSPYPLASLTEFVTLSPKNTQFFGSPLVPRPVAHYLHPMDFKSLDAAAQANLTPYGLERYYKYKAELCRNQSTIPGTEMYLPFEDIEATLRGFIWTEIEN
jgi:hypothetical protein